MTIPLALLVEDDPLNLQLVTMRLARMGYEVVSCTDAYSALEVLQEGHQFDLAVVDIRMPGMTGTELIERMRANRSWVGIPILVVSGEVSPNIASADHLLTKPYGRQGFEEAVAETFKRRGKPT